MKKILLLTALLFTILCFNVMAAWTIDISLESLREGYRVTITGVSDGSASDEFELDTSTLNSYLSVSDMQLLEGKLLWQVTTDPGTGVSAAYTIGLDNGAGADICTIPSRSTSSVEYYNIIDNVGTFMFVDNLQITFSDIGDATESVTAYFDFK